jgi:hypothetical protein
VPSNEIPVQPTQTNWRVDPVAGPDGSAWVMITITTCTGKFVTFLNGEDAPQLAQLISGASTRAKTGLILPGSMQ